MSMFLKKIISSIAVQYYFEIFWKIYLSYNSYKPFDLRLCLMFASSKISDAKFEYTA